MNQDNFKPISFSKEYLEMPKPFYMKKNPEKFREDLNKFIKYEFRSTSKWGWSPSEADEKEEFDKYFIEKWCWDDKAE